jgi:hypothetical protein
VRQYTLVIMGILQACTCVPKMASSRVRIATSVGVEAQEVAQYDPGFLANVAHLYLVPLARLPVP